MYYPTSLQIADIITIHLSASEKNLNMCLISNYVSLIEFSSLQYLRHVNIIRMFPDDPVYHNAVHVCTYIFSKRDYANSTSLT